MMTLYEAVTSYLEAIEAGRTPRRDDWLSRYGDVAPELAEFFADQDRVERRTANLRHSAGGPVLLQSNRI